MLNSHAKFLSAAMAVLIAAAVIGLTSLTGPASAASLRCGGRYHQFGMLLILKERNLSCATITRVAHALQHAKKLPLKTNGLTCRYDNIKAGGGADVCTGSDRRLVMFGNE